MTYFALYDILTFMFDLHYIPIKLISKQADVIVTHSHLLRVITKEAAIIVSLAHVLILFSAHQ